MYSKALIFFCLFFTGIRQLQLILFKIALMLGVEIHVNLEFVKVLEPPEDQENQSIMHLFIFKNVQKNHLKVMSGRIFI